MNSALLDDDFHRASGMVAEYRFAKHVGVSGYPSLHLSTTASSDALLRTEHFCRGSRGVKRQHTLRSDSCITTSRHLQPIGPGMPHLTPDTKNGAVWAAPCHSFAAFSQMQRRNWAD